MEKLLFIKELLHDFSGIGAIVPSSKYAARKMVEEIDFHSADCIVEYGPGTGVFTEKILEKSTKTEIVAIENNNKFYKILQNKFSDYNQLHLINGSAENIDSYRNEYNISNIDYIISSLPFSTLPGELTRVILKKTSQQLSSGGNFITLMYSQIKLKLFQKYFDSIDFKREFRNIPPAYIISCKNKAGEYN
ncbi:MAG: class I SAM-dependent methyltransferase [Halanaerobiales bacterium]